jgi:hypothetical protein
MTNRKFTESEIRDQDLESIETESWRHGTRQTFVFEHEGSHWMFTTEVSYDDGLQLYGPTEATQVHQVEETVTRKVWKPVD